MWQSLQTDDKGKTRHTDIVLPDKLKPFFACFDDKVPPMRPASKDSGLSFSVADVSKTLRVFTLARLAAQKASLAPSSEHVQTSWLECLRTYSISPYPSLLFPLASRCPPLFLYPRKPKVTELNDYRPIALTSVIMKCFERLVKDHSTCTFPDTLDLLKFVYHPNRSTDDAITIALTYPIWTRGTPM